MFQLSEQALVGKSTTSLSQLMPNTYSGTASEVTVTIDTPQTSFTVVQSWVNRNLEEIKHPIFYTALFAEFLGTLILVLVSCGSVTPWQPENPANVRISLTFAFSVATIVWNTGQLSGGHINPAVTLPLMFMRHISLVRGFFYVVCQCLGAFAGAAILSAIAPEHLSFERLGTPSPGFGVTGARVAMVELCITFVLVWTVFSTSDLGRTDHQGSGALAIGFSVGMCHLWAVPYTGAGMNPARVLGPAVISDTWRSHWAYWLGPLAGGTLAGLLYDFLMASNSSLAKVRAFFTSPIYNPDDIHSDKDFTVKL